VKIADMNRDGIQDLLVPAGDLRILQGRGDGTFLHKRSYSLDQDCLSLAVADFNRDGRMDVVAANFRGNELAVYQGRGKGRLRRPVPLPVGRMTRGLTAADVNGDGTPDLVASAVSPSNVNLGHELIVLLTEPKRGSPEKR
jgi:hypothetical protein